MADYVYWCKECRAFVDKDHRCEQWAWVYKIPVEAIEQAKKHAAEDSHD